MLRIDLTLEIARPPAEVFDYLIDVERLPDWQSSAVVAQSDGPLCAGARVSERRRLLGRELDTELEVTAYERPRRLTLRSHGGPVSFTVDHELVDDGDGTVLYVAAEAEPGGVMKLAEPLLARTAEQELRRDFDRLKEILESRP